MLFRLVLIFIHMRIFSNNKNALVKVYTKTEVGKKSPISSNKSYAFYCVFVLLRHILAQFFNYKKYRNLHPKASP